MFIGLQFSLVNQKRHFYKMSWLYGQTQRLFLLLRFGFLCDSRHSYPGVGCSNQARMIVDYPQAKNVVAGRKIHELLTEEPVLHCLFEGFWSQGSIESGDLRFDRVSLFRINLDAAIHCRVVDSILLVFKAERLRIDCKTDHDFVSRLWRKWKHAGLEDQRRGRGNIQAQRLNKGLCAKLLGI